MRSGCEREPVARQDRDDVEERAGAGHRVHEGDAADQHEAPVRGEQAELGAVRHVGRLGLVGGPDRARLGNREPGHRRGHQRRDRVGQEGRREAPVGGEQPAGQRPDADREDERALVGRHHAPAIGRRGDVRDDDQAGGEDERGACAGHEARADEGGVARRERAEHVADRGEDAADRQRVAPAEAVRELARGHRDEEAGEPVDRDGEPDGGLGDVEGARVEGQRGDDAAEAELVDGDEHAHPDEDADARGLSHDRLGVSLNRQGRPRPPGGPGAPGRLYPALAALEPDTSVVSGPGPGAGTTVWWAPHRPVTAPEVAFPRRSCGKLPG